MFDFDSERCFELPGDEPRTRFIFRPLTEEQWAQMEAAAARAQKARGALGHDPLDAESIRRTGKQERAGMAEAMLRTENPDETDKEVIEGLIAKLPTGLYRALLTQMRWGGEITAAEGKA